VYHILFLPKDEPRKSLWISKIKAKRVDSLPKEILLCSEHCKIQMMMEQGMSYVELIVWKMFLN